jgi:transporter family protein
MSENPSPWFLYSLITLLFWGFSSFFTKLATTHLKASNAYIYQIIGVLIVGIVMAFLVKFQPVGKPVGILFALAAGAVVTFGNFFFVSAMGSGRTAIVVMTTALYPLITLTLGYLILHETISLKQILGIALALVAIYLLSGS